MRKLQILFPEPQLRRLRDLAKREDRPVSEVVRKAVDAWLDRMSPGHTQAQAAPVFHGGRIGIGHERLRDVAHADRAGHDE